MLEPSLAVSPWDSHFLCRGPSEDYYTFSESIFGMEGLESEVLEFLANMADFVDIAVPGVRPSSPSSSVAVVHAHNDRVYPLPVTLRPAQLKRKRTLPLGVQSRELDRKQVVLFPGREHFKGVQCNNTYVSLLQGQSKWKKSASDTKGMKCGCSSVVSCTHSS